MNSLNAILRIKAAFVNQTIGLALSSCGLKIATLFKLKQIHHLKILLILLYIFQPNPLTAQIDSVFKIPFPRQYTVMDSIENKLELMDSIQAARLFALLDSASKRSTDELSINYYRYKKNSYQTGMIFRLQQKSNRDIDPNTLTKLINNYAQFLKELDQKKFPVIMALIHTEIGNLRNCKGNKFPKTFKDFIIANELFHKIPLNQYSNETRQRSQYLIAEAYYEFNDYEKAIELGTEIKEQFPKTNYISIFNAHLVGMSYLKTGKYKEAKEHFEWVMNNLGTDVNHPAWEGISLGNIGTINFMKGNFKEAILYYEMAIPKTIEGNVYDNTAIFAANLTSIYLKLNDIRLAKKYADLALTSLNKSPYEISQSASISNKVVVYEALKSLYKKTGNTILTIQYLDSVIYFKEMLAKRDDLNQKYRAEIAHEREKFETEKLKLEESAVAFQTKMNYQLIFFVSFMLITIIILAYTRFKLRFNAQKVSLDLERLEENELNNRTINLFPAQDALAIKKELLNKSFHHLHEKKGFAEKISDQFVAKKSKSTLQSEIISKLLNHKIKTDEDWSNFTNMYHEVYPFFFINLKQKMPSLSPAEIKYVALLNLNLNTKEISSILLISLEGVRQIKVRLKKKLEISDDKILISKINKI